MLKADDGRLRPFMQGYEAAKQSATATVHPRRAVDVARSDGI